MKLAIRIRDVRPGVGYAKMFFTTEVGYETDDGFSGVLRVRDMQLKESKAGELYAVFPQKQRMRGGQPVLEGGKSVWDNLVDTVNEKKDEKYVPTKASGAFKNLINNAAIAEFQTLTGDAGRGSAPRQEVRRAAPARGTSPTAAGRTTSTEAPDRGSPLGEASDLPF